VAVVVVFGGGVGGEGGGSEGGGVLTLQHKKQNFTWFYYRLYTACFDQASESYDVS
jgi:hypothetical protein